MAAVATVCGGSESSGSCNTSTAGSNSDSAAHDEREDVILEPLKLLKNTLPAPLQFGPMLLPSDSTSSPLKSTRLAGQLISCFVVGGECRLCLPQLLAMILPNISDTIIQKVYTELQIHTAVATLLQMESLKVSGILPPGTSSCSLIRKSDAERLVSRLLPQSSGRLKNPKLRENAISICHDDFGGCSGLLIPALITADEYCAAIECTECKLLFTGERFVSHTHQNSVKTGSNSGYQQICHWGFDTANWRYYIYLENESVDSAKDDLKQLQLFTNYKQIEAQNRLSALVSSQMQNALKRHSDTKVRIIFW
uniref:C-SKI_SMAD_bind domain-containing protein n=1 Tax=Syphacia muris TaxID=451379 RepID=A0A0N5B0C7_9BILA